MKRYFTAMICIVMLISLFLVPAYAEDTLTDETPGDTLPIPPDALEVVPENLIAENSGHEQITVTWTPVAGADGYRVYRKVEETSWKKLGDVTEACYSDESAEVGVTYLYTVRPYREIDGEIALGLYDPDGVACLSEFIPYPHELTAAATGYRQITVNWSAVKNVDGYRLYRKTVGGSWQKLLDTQSTTYEDATAEEGVTYLYTVRAYQKTADGVIWSLYDKAGAACAWEFFAPEEVSIKATGYREVTLNWHEIGNVDGYRVYRKEPGMTGWKRLGDVTKTTYLDRSAENDMDYIYTVRGFKKENGETVLGAYNKTGYACKTEFFAPEEVSVKATGYREVTLNWSEIGNVDGYRVYRKEPGMTGWKRLGDVTKTTYLDRSAENDKEYIYTVRGFKKVNGETILGAYDKTGYACKTEFFAPEEVSVKATGYREVTLNWHEIGNVDGYRVYRKEPGMTGWKRLGDVTKTTYLDRSAENDMDYIYTVRGFKKENGETVLGAYDKTGYACKTEFFAPEEVSVKATGYREVTLNWSEIGNVDGYRVYRKEPGMTGWKRLGDVTKTTYRDTTAENDMDYIYTVRGFKKVNGETILGIYDKAGYSCKAEFIAPQLTSAVNTSHKVIVLEWSKLGNVDGYRVYRKDPGMTGWKRLGDVTKTTYTDRTAVEGAEYLYTVRGYRKVSGETILGNYEKNGIACKSHLTGKTHYHQGDDRWGFSRSLEKKACVLTAVSMVLKNNGANATPKTVYAANNNNAGMSFTRALKKYDSKYAKAISTKSAYYAGYDSSYGFTYIKNPEKNTTAAIKEALRLHPEGVVCYFVKGNDMHAVVAIGYHGDTIYYSDPGRVKSKGHNVTWKNTWCHVSHKMNYGHLKGIIAID